MRQCYRVKRWETIVEQGTNSFLILSSALIFMFNNKNDGFSWPKKQEIAQLSHHTTPHTRWIKIYEKKESDKLGMESEP